MELVQEVILVERVKIGFYSRRSERFQQWFVLRVLICSIDATTTKYFDNDDRDSAVSFLMLGITCFKSNVWKATWCGHGFDWFQFQRQLGRSS